MVTSHKMSENEMDYRGSKSEYLMDSVKEQRVDGSWSIKTKFSKMLLRYTLMGFERNYLVKIPSKQLNIKKFSSLPCTTRPWFWTGLIDAEGSFTILINKSKSHKLEWRVQTKFQMGLHKRDLSLLLQLQEYLGGVGNIYTKPNLNMVNYVISSNKELTSLINHLEKYPLLSQKAADFILFHQVIQLINSKHHLSIEGLNKIINLKASMNLGLSDFLKSEFIDFCPIERPVIKTENIPDGNWISGFVSGEGNFDVRILQQLSNKIGYRVQLRFRISQHERDSLLMESLIKYLGSGRLYKYSGKPAVVLTVFKFSDVINNIIPFFEKYPILGVKQLDYLDWCKVAKLVNDGYHLKHEGLNSITEIKSGMNRGRK